MNQPGGKDVRTRVLETLQKYKIKQIDVARQTGMHHSTLCLWLQGKIRGHQVKTEETLNRWLESFSENKAQLSKTTATKGPGAKQEIMDPVAEAEKVNPVLVALKKEDEIIPVRIDIESEGIRFKDNVYWNLHEPLMTPENFAKTIADDNGLPPFFENEIVMSIRKAMQSYRKYVPILPEMIKVITLDLRVDNICLKDRFEWDINDTNNNPEEFALNLCNELGLDFEFLGLIAHSIREQIQSYQRQAMERGLADFRGSEDFMQMKKSTRSLLESGTPATKKSLEQVLITEENYLRSLPLEPNFQFEANDINRWEPRVEVLDPEEIAKIKKLEDRKNRYEKRHR